VSRVCRMVEGLPLCVELAASWARVMSCDQIATRIEHDLGFLETSARNVPERHRSIRVLFEHSFGILAPEEQAVMMRLSVFRGPFWLESAEQVAGATPAVLRSLVEKSLLRSDGADEYTMHQLLRRFAEENLTASGEAEATFDAYAAYFADYVCAHSRQAEADAIERCYDDIRSAMTWIEQRADSINMLRMAGSLYQFWNTRGMQTEGRQWLDRALALDDGTAPPDIRAEAIQVAGVLAWKQSDFAPAREYLERALELYRQLEDAQEIASTIMYLGYLTMNVGDHEGARSYYLEMLEAGRTVGDENIMGRALGSLGLLELELTNYEASKAYFEEALALTEKSQSRDAMNMIISNLGVLSLKIGDYQLAEHYLSRALELAREVKNKVNIVIALINLGETAHYQQNLPLAVERYLEGFPILEEIGDKVSIVSTLEMFAFLSIDLGAVESGLSLLAAMEHQREVLNAPIIPRERVRYDQYLALARERLNGKPFEEVWSAGRKLTLERATAMALEHLRQ